MNADMQIEPLRRQLAETADAMGAAIAHGSAHPSPDGLETLSIRLSGVARLAMQLRSAILAEQGARNAA